MKISVSGVDGTGKTSLIDSIQSQFKNQPNRVRAFRVPQYHEDSSIPFADLSEKMDSLGVFADRISDPILKVCGLFLSMTLFGDVESHYEKTYQPEYLFFERFALADSLTYSKFYKQFITGPLNRTKIEAAVLKELGPDSIALFEDWIQVLKSRLPKNSPIDAAAIDFWSLPLFIKSLFELQPAALIHHLQALYQCGFPDHVILLKVSSTRLMERIAKKAQGGTQKELHEKQGILEALQGGLEQCNQLLVQMNPRIQLHVIDTSQMSIEETAALCFKKVGLKTE